MNKYLHSKRLSIAFKELWLSNRTYIGSLPLVMLLAFVIYYLWPGSIFYNKIFHANVFPSSDNWIKTTLDFNAVYRAFILFIVPIYVVICTKPFLDKLNRSERTNLIPISRFERTVSLSLFAMGVIGLGVICFVIYDFAFVSWLKHLYYEQALDYLARQGDLYPRIWDKSIFHTIPVRGLSTIFISMLLLLPLYFLSFVFFKQQSFLLFVGLLAFIWAILLALLHQLPRDNHGFSVTLQQGVPTMINIILTLGYWCLAMTSFYYKLKEKEI